MSHPYYHSLSSVKQFGGEWNDYMKIHEWFDQTKLVIPDCRHRAILHSSFGIFLCQQVFGEILVRESDGKSVPLRTIAERHVIEDMGFIPTPQDWFAGMKAEIWMAKGAKSLSKEEEQVIVD